MTGKDNTVTLSHLSEPQKKSHKVCDIRIEMSSLASIEKSEQRIMEPVWLVEPVPDEIVLATARSASMNDLPLHQPEKLQLQTNKTTILLPFVNQSISTTSAINTPREFFNGTLTNKSPNLDVLVSQTLNANLSSKKPDLIQEEPSYATVLQPIAEDESPVVL